ncbi:hypothetical protein [Mycolicibacterium sp.]|uniref:hypothetical protein n=1 Tax=Mycolicibacterium sp. TaxID=2320850 RepID=UPI00355DB513
MSTRGAEKRSVTKAEPPAGDPLASVAPADKTGAELESIAAQADTPLNAVRQ